MKNFSIQRHFLLLSLLLLHAAPMQALYPFTSEDSGYSTQYEYKFEAIKADCKKGTDNFEKLVQAKIVEKMKEGWSLEQHSAGYGAGGAASSGWSYYYHECLCTLIFKRAINKKVANNQAAPISSDKGEDIITNP